MIVWCLDIYKIRNHLCQIKWKVSFCFRYLLIYNLSFLILESHSEYFLVTDLNFITFFNVTLVFGKESNQIIIK